MSSHVERAAPARGRRHRDTHVQAGDNDGHDDVITYEAGVGATDGEARGPVAAAMEKVLKNPVVVVNKTGAAGAVAASGTIWMIGARKRNGKKSAPQTTASCLPFRRKAR